MNHSRWLLCSVRNDDIHALPNHTLAQLIIQPVYERVDQEPWTDSFLAFLENRLLNSIIGEVLSGIGGQAYDAEYQMNAFV